MAGLNVRDATSDRAIAAISATDAGGVDRSIQEGRIIDPDGVDRAFFNQFAVFAAPTSVSARINSASSATATTRSASAGVVGAIGAVTYAWSQTSGDPMTITDPSSEITAFSAAVGPSGSASGNFICTITDSGGHSGVTNSVNATVSNSYGGTL